MTHTPPLPEPGARRHDLDALRAFAMLLGIVLHVGPPIAQGAGPGEAWFPPVMSWLVNNIHGFRMPLFFLLSGFFTAMLWQRRGLAALVRHRFKRIFLPLMLGLVTIIPTIMGAGALMGMLRGGGAGPLPPDTIWEAARGGDATALVQHIASGTPLDEPDPRFGVPPLVWTAMAGHAPLAEALLDAGADIHAGDREGATALHRAVLLGRAETARLLIERGADLERLDNNDRRPRDFAQAPPQMAAQFAGQHGIPLPPPRIMEGRHALAPLLGAGEPAGPGEPGQGGGQPLPPGSIWEAARGGDGPALARLIASGSPLDGPDPVFGVPPLVWAAMAGQAPLVAALLDAGADIHAGDREGATALHRAVLLGRAEAARLLLERGADPERRDDAGRLPGDFGQVPPPMAGQFAGGHGIPIPPPEIMAGRQALAGVMGFAMPRGPGQRGGRGGGLFSGPLFDFAIWWHLWFLWYLVWLIAGFVAFAKAADRFQWKPLPLWLMRAPVCLMWIVPLTLLPQLFMPDGAFGPDASLGLIPKPHILLYYATFFGFGGAMYFSGDGPARIGVGWWALIPIALAVLYPLATVYHIANDLAQVLFTWFMSFGFIGLFRVALHKERPWVRYMSDASYWLYLAHVPVVMVLSGLANGWPMPAVAKFFLVCAITVLGLLLIYAKLVRYTWLGALLNGPRIRPARTTTATAGPESAEA